MMENANQNNLQNNLFDFSKKLPKDVDTINFWAVSWCEEMLDDPTEADIQWTEAYIAELLLSLEEKR